jgi:prevent-host-death family protein
MDISVSEAKAHLSDLVRRAEEGERVTLTRHGQPVAEIVPAKQRKTDDEFLEALRRIGEEGRKRVTPGPDAAHASDFLFGDDGMPE